MKPNSASHINHAKTKEKGMRIVGRDSPELEYGVPCLFQACRRRNQRKRNGAVRNSEEKQQNIEGSTSSHDFWRFGSEKT